MLEIRYALDPEVDEPELNALFASTWPKHEERSFKAVLDQSLTHVCAYAGGKRIGFVNLAWDGGVHGFILDPTVHPEFQRRGVGRELVQRAAAVAREHGLIWLHVDWLEGLEPFYLACGFRPTHAGLIHLGDDHKTRQES